MIIQYHDVVKCDVCKYVKRGGKVTYDEKNHMVEYAICDDCEGKNK